MERRRYSSASTATIEQRSDGTSLIVGYAAVFYRDGDPGTEFELLPGLVERITPTAFTRSLGEGEDVVGLFNHEASEILGRTSAGTMTLIIDDRGLRYEIEPPDTPWGRGVMTSIERGDITGSSFSFEPRARGSAIVSDDDVDVRELRDVKLYDVGPVTYPAYGATSTGIRSQGDLMAELRKEYERYQQVQKRLRELRK